MGAAITEAGRNLGSKPVVESGSSARTWLVLASLWLICTLFNLTKAYHIDDTAHLIIAHWILVDPFHPLSGNLNWGGINEPIFVTNQPHLYFYVLAGWIRIFGDSEVALHALQSLFTGGAIVLFYRLARRILADHALWLTAAFALNPAFLVEQNLMVDVPLVCLWLLFFERLTQTPDRPWRLVVASLACAAACLVKYSSVALFPILVLAVVLERKWSRAWVILVPVAAVLGWSAFNIHDFGRAHLLGRSDSGAGKSVVLFTYLWVLTLGAILPIGLVPVMQAAQRLVLKRARIETLMMAFAAAFVVLAALVATDIVKEKVSDNVLRLVFIASGLGVLYLWFVDFIGTFKSPKDLLAEDRRPLLYLALWVAVCTGFYIVFAPFIATRHVLLIVPPVLIATLAAVPEAILRPAKLFALTASVVLSVGLGISDWRFAGFFREAAAKVRAITGDHRTWAVGHWGWQWYAAKNGMEQVDIAATTFQPGDYIAVADSADHLMPKAMPPTDLVTEITSSHPLLSLFCTGKVARFYVTYRTGPWSLNSQCDQQVTLLRVKEEAGAGQKTP